MSIRVLISFACGGIPMRQKSASWQLLSIIGELSASNFHRRPWHQLELYFPSFYLYHYVLVFQARDLGLGQLRGIAREISLIQVAT